MHLSVTYVFLLPYTMIDIEVFLINPLCNTLNLTY